MERKDKFGIKFEMINGSQKGVQNESRVRNVRLYNQHIL